MYQHIPFFCNFEEGVWIIDGFLLLTLYFFLVHLDTITSLHREHCFSLCAAHLSLSHLHEEKQCIKVSVASSFLKFSSWLLLSIFWIYFPAKLLNTCWFSCRSDPLNVRKNRYFLNSWDRLFSALASFCL